MNHSTEVFVGIDVAKVRNAVAIADGERGGEVRYLGEVASSEESMRRLVKRIAAKHDRVHFCYEAGPTGYGLYRLITALGHPCAVVAPSLIPRKPGDRVKTNRRDAVALAKLLRAGELDVAALGKSPIATVAVDLQHTLEAGKMSNRPLGLAVGCVDVGDAGRVRPAPGSIIARIGPELAGLGSSAPRIEHRRRGLVGEQLGRTLQLHEQPFVNRPQQPCGLADPISQGRAVEVDPLPGVDLGLPVEMR